MHLIIENLQPKNIKKLRLPQEKALFLFINNKIVSSTKMIGEIYEKNKHSDGFLYVSYSYENVFG